MGELRALDGGRDPFALDKGNYDPDEFYVDHTDRRGHRDRVQVSLPQGLAGQVAFVIGKFDAYRTPGDFYADAIHHRLQWCLERVDEAEDLSLYLVSDRVKARTEVVMRQTQNNIEAVQGIQQVLDLTSQTKDDRALQKMIEYAIEAAENMEEPYKSQIMEKVERMRK